MGEVAESVVVLKDGRRVTLRSVRADDAVASHAFISAGMAGYTTLASSAGELSVTVEQHAEQLASMTRDERQVFLLAFDELGAIVGQLGIFVSAKRKMKHHATLGMMTGPAWQGVGLGRAMLRAGLDWAAAESSLECVRLGVYASNAPAVALYTSLGFRVEGVLRQYFVNADGTRHDDLAMALWVKPGLAPEGFCAWQVGRAACRVIHELSIQRGPASGPISGLGGGGSA
jgi:RimJ/RimL family protein N-acetyltransferase